MNKEDLIKIKNFLKEYKSYLDSNLYDFLASNLTTTDEDIKRLDVMLQVYSYLKIDNGYTRYDLSLDELKDNFDINSNILEVAAGYIPSFALNLKEVQSSGSVTAMDKNIIDKDFESIEVVRKNFTKDLVTNKDLIIALYPCEATLPLIDNAIANNTNLFISMCECVPAGMRMFCRSSDAWFDVVYRYLKANHEDMEYNMYETSRDTNFNNPFITLKRTK